MKSTATEASPAVETTASMKAATASAATPATRPRCSVISADREQGGKKQGNKSGFEKRRHGSLRDIPCSRKVRPNGAQL